MGKPFIKELEIVEDTYAWSFVQETDIIEKILSESSAPVYVVGSGGSLSACHFAVYLLQKKGILAKAITPLELFYSLNAVNNARVVFLSASGKNTDILFAFNKAIVSEPISLTTICMKRNTPLSALASKYSVCRSVEYNIPSGKDGFLATNSLIAYFTILQKAFDETREQIENVQDFRQEIDAFITEVPKDSTLTVLYGGWGHPVAVDVESKFTEAALGNVHISDYRNFAHGRHHWFAKRGDNSAIVALVTPQEKAIALKTLSLLPPSIPRLLLTSNYSSSTASIDLLIQSFELVSRFGSDVNIDPGKPGVPDFGRKLYNLKYASFYEPKKKAQPV